MMKKHIHLSTTLCSMLSAAWQADYRSTPRSENKGFIGANGVYV
jgi:hypothetical protein